MQQVLFFLIMSVFVGTAFGSDREKSVIVRQGGNQVSLHESISTDVSCYILQYCDKSCLLALRAVNKQWRDMLFFKVESIDFNCKTEKCFVSTYDTDDYEFKDLIYPLPIAYVDRFSDPKTMMLCYLLKKNYLDLNRISFENKSIDGMGLFFKMLSKNNFLTTLSFDNKSKYKDVMGAEGAKSLSEALKVNNTLTSISFDSNKLGAEGAISLSEALKVNNTLTKINLSNNNFSNEGVEELSEALKVNSTLHRIDLESNFINDECEKRFREVAKSKGDGFRFYLSNFSVLAGGVTIYVSR